MEAEEESRASRCTSVPYSWTSTAKLFIQHTIDLPCLFAQQGACVPSVHHWVHEWVSKWASESYLSVRSHHGIVGIVGGRLRVRGRLRPWRTLVKKKERCQSCYANIFGDIQTFLRKKTSYDLGLYSRFNVRTMCCHALHSLQMNLHFHAFCICP